MVLRVICAVTEKNPQTSCRRSLERPAWPFPYYSSMRNSVKCFAEVQRNNYNIWISRE